MTIQGLEVMIERLVENQEQEKENKIAEVKCITYKNKIATDHIMKEL